MPPVPPGQKRIGEHSCTVFDYCSPYSSIILYTTHPTIASAFICQQRGPRTKNESVFIDIMARSYYSCRMNPGFAPLLSRYRFPAVAWPRGQPARSFHSIPVQRLTVRRGVPNRGIVRSCALTRNLSPVRHKRKYLSLGKHM